MRREKNILDLVAKSTAEAERASRRGLILHSGALGDCILTLPLVEFMNEQICPGGVDMMGHTDYLGILPSRSAVAAVRAMESVELHRLFVESSKFDVGEPDRLVQVFSQYEWIVTFLGEPGGDFEQNLLFAAHCGASSDVVTLGLRPEKKTGIHVAEYHILEFVDQSGLDIPRPQVQLNQQFLKPETGDIEMGRQLLKSLIEEECSRVVIIHPGSGGREKCWFFENFFAIAKKLKQSGFRPVFLFGPAEQERLDRELIGRAENNFICFEGLKLEEVVGLLACANDYVGNDSGISHLAGAMGLRTATVFGPTETSEYRPLGPDVGVFKSNSDNFTGKPDEELISKIATWLID